MKTRQPVWNDLHYMDERQTNGSLVEKTFELEN